MHHQLTITLIKVYQSYMTQSPKLASLTVSASRNSIEEAVADLDFQFRELIGKAIAFQRTSLQTSLK